LLIAAGINHWDCGHVLAEMNGEVYKPNLCHKRVKIRAKTGKNEYLRGEVLRQKIEEIFKKFSTDLKLEESRHPWSSQMCEVINGKVARKSPKDRDYSRDHSYHLRVHAAIGEVNLGYVALHTAELLRLGIKPGLHFTRQLQALADHRTYVVHRAGTQEGKARRKHGYQASTYARAQEAKTSCEDVYETGCVMMDEQVPDAELGYL